jgi:cytochrome P450
VLNQLSAMRTLARKRFDGLMDIYRKHGPVFTLGRYVYLLGPEANRFVITNPDLFRWSEAFELLKPVVGDTSLIVSDGDDHKRRRALVQPAFHHRHVNGYLEILAGDSDRLVDGWAPAGKLDLYWEFRRAFRRMNVQSLFGARIGEHADSFGDQLQPMLELIDRLPVAVAVHRRLRTPAWRRAMAGKQATDQQILDEITRLRETGDDDDRVLGTLVKSDLTDVEIRDQVIGLISAGFETTSAAMTWTVHALRTNEGAWDTAKAEVDNVLGDRAPTAADLPKLVHLNGVIQESLRLWPPAPVSIRVPAEDFTFEGKRIKAGQQVFYSPYVTHRLGEIWPEPTRFMPERWDTTNPVYRKPAPHEFLPFGGGPHRCVGSTLATTELTVMLARLLARVTIDLEPGPVVAAGVTSMRPRGGLPAWVTKNA